MSGAVRLDINLYDAVSRRYSSLYFPSPFFDVALNCLSLPNPQIGTAVDYDYRLRSYMIGSGNHSDYLMVMSAMPNRDKYEQPMLRVRAAEIDHGTWKQVFDKTGRLKSVSQLVAGQGVVVDGVKPGKIVNPEFFTEDGKPTRALYEAVEARLKVSLHERYRQALDLRRITIPNRRILMEDPATAVYLEYFGLKPEDLIVMCFPAEEMSQLKGEIVAYQGGSVLQLQPPSGLDRGPVSLQLERPGNYVGIDPDIDDNNFRFIPGNGEFAFGSDGEEMLPLVVCLLIGATLWKEQGL